MRVEWVVSALMVSASPALSCLTLENSGLIFDRRTTVDEQCEYANADKDDRNVNSTGRPVVDVGAGKVAQSRTKSAGCSIENTLLVVDCTRPQAIAIQGTVSEEETGNGLFVESIRGIQISGGGPIALRATTTIDELLAISEKHQLIYVTGPELVKSDQEVGLDTFCGCKLYYPDTPGAAN